VGRSTQGDGSSPSGPIISKRDRDRLARYDRAIHLLDIQIVDKRRVRARDLCKVVAKRTAIDMKRLKLRMQMKGYG